MQKSGSKSLLRIRHAAMTIQSVDNKSKTTIDTLFSFFLSSVYERFIFSFLKARV